VYRKERKKNEIERTKEKEKSSKQQQAAEQNSHTQFIFSFSALFLASAWLAITNVYRKERKKNEMERMKEKEKSSKQQQAALHISHTPLSSINLACNNKCVQKRENEKQDGENVRKRSFQPALTPSNSF
jgi:hypothetical protein